MGIFDGVLICTDIDGTLLKNDMTISEENIRAIEYFKSNGGSFSIITGRMPFFITDICLAVRPNVPVGCVNGGGLYDFEKGEYIRKSVMPPEVTELIRCVDDNVPGAGIQVNTFYKVYFCKDNDAMVEFRERTKLPNITCDYNNVDEPVAKIVFAAGSDEEMLEIIRVLNSHPLACKFDFIQSEKTLYEILPKGINKGTAVAGLVEYTGADANKTIAIGDYNNDIPMFAAAKTGIAVANASPEALEAADYVTVSNEENAIAKVIKDLEKNIKRQI